ncbi:MAG: hypothetical protein RJB39_802 [Candidatus Parcubacteria bacterium]|jgi:UPF0755 protein
MSYEKDFVHIPETSQSLIMPVDKIKPMTPQAPRPKRHPLVRFLVWAFVFAVLIVIVGGLFVYQKIITPVGVAVSEEAPIIMDIPKGSTLNEIVDKLEARDLITSPTVFKMIMLLTHKEASMKTGEYTFKRQMNMLETMDKLVNGKYEYVPVRLTIKEGEDSKVIADRIVSLFPKLTPTEVFAKLKAAEGKIFPETYMFAPFNTLDDILKTTQAEYEKRVAKFRPEIASSTHSEDEILTVASILEKEVPRHSDMKIVAGIIYNRLKIGMPLQMDSTLGYITGKASLELTTDDLKSDSPYNTYVAKGLPPGPIGNPGEDAIKAALEPETHQYLFFLSDKNSDNHYAKTYAEHLRNRKLYLGK